MKKILLYIDNMLFGGANRVMSNLANHFSNIGYETVLVNDRPYDEESPGYTIDVGIKRYYLDSGEQNLLVKTMNRVKTLRGIIKSEKPDVVLSFMAGPNIRMLIATIGVTTKKVVSVRNDPYREYGHGIQKTIANILFRMANGVVFQTDEAAGYFTKKIRSKSKVIFNPVNEKFYERKWQPGGNNIVVIGRLQPQKNPMLVLRAFAQISDSMPGITLDFVGEGELKAELQEEAMNLSVANRVNFFGKREDIDYILEQSGVYVLCSDFEGMPNALMEAMTVGIPVISTDCPCGGPRALIEREEQGLLVPCGDEAALAQALLTVLTDEARQLRMSAAAAERARQFRPDIVLNEWEAFLNRE